MGDDISEGGLAITAFPVGNDQCLKADLPNGGEASDLLNVAHKLGIFHEEGVQRYQPDIPVLVVWIHEGLLGDEVLRGVLMESGDSPAQVVCGGWCVQQELVRVQLPLADLYHGPRLLQGRGDILRVPALDGIVAVDNGVLVFLEDPDLNKVHGQCSPFAAYRGQQFPCSVLRHIGSEFLDLRFSILKLACDKLLCHGLRLRLRFFPEADVVDKVVGGRTVAELPTVFTGKHDCLSDVGVVTGFQ